MRLGTLKIYSRGDWHPNGGRGDAVPFQISGTTFIHHTASPYGDPDSFAEQCAVMREIEREHLAKGWDGIGYSFVVFQPFRRKVKHGARIFEGRGMNRIPAAQLNHNYGNSAVCVVGNFDNEPVFGLTVDKVVALVKRMPGRHLLGHRDVNDTACPGAHLYANLPTIRKRTGRSK